MNWCNNITDLGCIRACDEEIATGLTATITGTYKIQYSHNGVLKSFDVSVNASTDVVIPNNFNENKITEFKIIDPNGDDGDKVYRIKIS